LATQEFRKFDLDFEEDSKKIVRKNAEIHRTNIGSAGNQELKKIHIEYVNKNLSVEKSKKLTQKKIL
jgi:hypothetical protein